MYCVTGVHSLRSPSLKNVRGGGGSINDQLCHGGALHPHYLPIVSAILNLEVRIRKYPCII